MDTKTANAWLVATGLATLGVAALGTWYQRQQLQLAREKQLG